MLFLPTSVTTTIILDVAVEIMKDDGQGGGEDTEAQEVEGATIMAKA